jgi:hypothetical protein
MFPTPPINDILTLTLGLVFQLWPILILSPLTGRQGGWLWKMFLVWIIILPMRILLAINTPSGPGYTNWLHILPEPTYTILFGAVGALIIVFIALRNFARVGR